MEFYYNEDETPITEDEFNELFQGAILDEVKWETKFVSWLEKIETNIEGDLYKKKNKQYEQELKTEHKVCICNIWFEVKGEEL
jgi:hypothetical protein